MSKSVLPIVVSSPVNGLTVLLSTRTIEVPCRMPEAFSFKSDGWLFTALVSGETVDATVYDVESEATGFSAHEYTLAKQRAEAILSDAKRFLTAVGGPILTSIALAYEAEVAAYDAAVKAHRELPRTISGDVMYWVDPRERTSMACRMLAKYVEYVFEQAAKAQEVK